MIAKEADLELSRLADEAAERYLRSLPLEHFMEATDHATQRKITVESFDLIHEARPDIQCFNELLVQYPREGRRKKKLQGVVPDNMVVVCSETIQAEGQFTVTEQPVGPFLMLEYISKHSKQKDYEDNFDRYEQELKVPYYLLYQPAVQDLKVFRLADGEYVPIEDNPEGRLAIPELELEVAVLEGWARFWFRRELLPLPGELLKQLTATEDQLKAALEARDRAEQRAAILEAELVRMKEELARRPQP